MTVLPCPLGIRCTDGEGGTTWKTVDVTFEQARLLISDHVKFAHQSGASAAPARQDSGLTLNKVGTGGTQGGNFSNSSLHKPTFNLDKSEGQAITQNYAVMGRGNFVVSRNNNGSESGEKEITDQNQEVALAFISLSLEAIVEIANRNPAHMGSRIMDSMSMVNMGNRNRRNKH